MRLKIATTVVIVTSLAIGLSAIAQPGGTKEVVATTAVTSSPLVRVAAQSKMIRMADEETTTTTTTTIVARRVQTTERVRTRPAVSSGNYYSSSRFEACVLKAESGTVLPNHINAYEMNSSGHWGAYQFAYSRWVAAGGIPAHWSHVGFAEQQQVFHRAIALGMASAWTCCDGC